MATTTQVKKKVVSPKKRASKAPVSRTEDQVVYAEGEQCFWSNDGHILSSLYDLEHALSCMDAESYNHHVTSDKNDFAAWVEYVLLDTACADGLRKAKNQKAALACVEQRLGRSA